MGLPLISPPDPVVPDILLPDWSGPHGQPVENGRLPVYPPKDGSSFFTEVINCCTNPSAEIDATGWTTFGTNTIAQIITHAFLGRASIRSTYGNDLRLAAAPISSAGYPDPFEFIFMSAYVWQAGGYTGGSVYLDDGGALGATLIDRKVSAATNVKWQYIWTLLQNDKDAATVWKPTVNANSAPGAGQQVLIDAVLVTLGTTLPIAYFDGDQLDSSWDGLANASSSTKLLQAYNNQPPVDWSITDVAADFSGYPA